MKLSEAMARADALRLNTVSEEQKAKWIWELEGQLGEMASILPRPCPWPEGKDTILLLTGPYEEVYQLYLAAKIDYYNQEMGLYANDRATYETMLAEARAWWRRKHRPKKSGNWKAM